MKKRKTHEFTTVVDSYHTLANPRQARVFSLFFSFPSDEDLGITRSPQIVASQAGHPGLDLVLEASL